MPYIEAQIYLNMKVHPEASYMEAFDDFPIDNLRNPQLDPGFTFQIICQNLKPPPPKNTNSQNSDL